MARTNSPARSQAMPRQRLAIGLTLLAAASLSSTGCFWGLTSGGPSLGVAAVPIPVSTFHQKKQEDQYWQKERYGRVPILGPVTSGGPPKALDEPSDDEVMRALESVQPVQGGIPFLWTRNRNNVRIVKCLIADYVDPVRVYPLIGPAQLHHAHYKCTVYYEDVRRVGWPVPHTIVDEDAREVLYIDHNHLHRVGGDPGDCSPY
ncbi:MAG: hypothetical protein AAGJ46_09855 [Planctomycetota bacterium]